MSAATIIPDHSASQGLSADSSTDWLQTGYFYQDESYSQREARWQLSAVQMSVPCSCFPGSNQAGGSFRHLPNHQGLNELLPRVSTVRGVGYGGPQTQTEDLTFSYHLGRGTQQLQGKRVTHTETRVLGKARGFLRASVSQTGGSGAWGLLLRKWHPRAEGWAGVSRAQQWSIWHKWQGGEKKARGPWVCICM